MTGTAASDEQSLRRAVLLQLADGVARRVLGGARRAREAALDHGRRAVVEAKETRDMLGIWVAFLSGRPVPAPRLATARAQALDLARVVVLGLPQLVPLPLVGALAALTLIRVGERAGLRVLPSAWARAPEHLAALLEEAERGEGVAYVRYQDGWLKRYDAQGRPHCGDGPAYRNPETGEELWYRHGVLTAEPRSRAGIAA